MNIDDLLTPFNRPADPRLRQQLREQTTRRLRRARWIRVGKFAAALAACYAAGAATVWLTRPTPAPARVEVTPPEPLKEPERSPQQLELAAEQADGEESARLYLAAARKFAKEYGNWGAALRCYRNALDVSPEIQTTIDAENDDWLMTALKLSRKEEPIHAND